MKFHLTKRKKITTMKTLCQILPCGRLSQVYMCYWTELRPELDLITMSFSRPFTGQRWERKAELSRFKKVALKTINNEWTCSKAKTILFASGKAWAVSLPVLGVICMQKIPSFSLLHVEAVAVYTPWSSWLWGFSNGKHLWHPSCTVALSSSTADLFHEVKRIVYNSS